MFRFATNHLIIPAVARLRNAPARHHHKPNLRDVGESNHGVQWDPPVREPLMQTRLHRDSRVTKQPSDNPVTIHAPRTAFAAGMIDWLCVIASQRSCRSSTAQWRPQQACAPEPTLGQPGTGRHRKTSAPLREAPWLVIAPPARHATTTYNTTPIASHTLATYCRT